MRNFLNRLFRFAKALYFHIGYGLPKCNQNQIDERYSICVECEFFDMSHSQCLQCGCNVNNKRKFLNKLAWSDQHCPINKWQKEI